MRAKQFRQKWPLVVAALISSGAGLLNGAMTPEEIWSTHCHVCHGMDGKGKTESGKLLKLFSFQDKARQAELTDKQIVEAIRYGKEDDFGMPLMVPYEEILTAAEIQSMIAYIRAFANAEAP